MEIELGIDPLRKSGLQSFGKDFFSHSLENVSSILQNSKPLPKIQKSNSVTALSERRIGPYIVGDSVGVGSYSRVNIGVHISSKEEVRTSLIMSKELAKAF